MDLSDLLSRYPRLGVADANDNAAVLALFDRLGMEGERLRIRYERHPDFFRFLRCRGESSYVLTGRSLSGELAGIGSITLRPGYVKGKLETVGYLGDLRISFDRELAVRWREFYGELISRSREITELKDCHHFLTAVIDENIAARAALVAPFNKRAARPGRPAFRYSPLARYRMVNLLARHPGAGRASRKLRAHCPELSVSFGASPAELDEIAMLLDLDQRQREFGYCFGGDAKDGELRRRLTEWEGLFASSFVCVRDGRGRLIACAAPWNPRAAKRIIVERVPVSLKASFVAARVLSWGRIRPPAEGQELGVEYLTHLAFRPDLGMPEKDTAFRAIVDRLFERPPQLMPSVLAFADFNEDSRSGALGGYLTQTIPMTLFRVGQGLGSPGAEELPPLGRPPGFEIALV